MERQISVTITDAQEAQLAIDAAESGETARALLTRIVAKTIGDRIDARIVARQRKFDSDIVSALGSADAQTRSAVAAALGVSL